MMSVEEFRRLEKAFTQGTGCRIEQSIRIGFQIGFKQGLREGIRRTLLRLMETRFGPLTEETRQKVVAISDPQRLEDLTVAVLTVNSLADLDLSDPA